MNDIYCPDCKSKQESRADKVYVKFYHTCWHCDQQREKQGLLASERLKELAQIREEFNDL
jgi:hypothetical protein